MVDGGFETLVGMKMCKFWHVQCVLTVVRAAKDWLKMSTI